MNGTQFDTHAYLTVPWGDKRDLSRFAALLEYLGNPQRTFRAVHVAGTNGKGSTCAYLDSILRVSGRKVGLYTSPSLIRLNERIRVNGVSIDDEALTAAAEKVAQAERDMRCGYGGFDRLTAAAFVAFAAAGMEFAVLETGLGGRLDATNAAEAEVAVLAPIGIDHAHLLGNTVELIAREKCGIIKPNQFVVAAPQEGVVEEMIAAACKEKGAHLLQLSKRQIVPGGAEHTGQDFVLATKNGAYLQLRTPLLGRHQMCNASMAATAARALGCDALAIQKGIATTKWPARMEYFPAGSGTDPDVLIDGAHNPHAARALLDGLNQLFSDRPIVMIAAIMGDKDAQGVLHILSERVNHIVAVRCTERSLLPEQIQAMAKRDSITAQTADSIPEALRAAKAFCRTLEGDPLLLVTGSLYLAGRVRQMLLEE